MKYVSSQLKARFDQLGYKWFPFHLIGVRSKSDTPDAFDDKFYLIFGRACYEFSGTTNPGVHYLKNPLTKKGAAVVKPGQYIDVYTLGKHRGQYEAWVQAKPITVCRDNDKDDKSECNGVEEKGFFGINIHRSALGWISKIIDRWSAGCGVLNVPKEYKLFINLTKQSGMKFYTYTLLDEWDVNKK